MRKRLILYIVFAAYQLIAFIFTVMVDGHMDLLGLLKYIPVFKYISFLGVLLFFIDFIWYLVERRSVSKELEEMRDENNILKAKIYDFQEAAKEEKTENHSKQK